MSMTILPTVVTEMSKIFDTGTKGRGFKIGFERTEEEVAHSRFHMNSSPTVSSQVSSFSVDVVDCIGQPGLRHRGIQSSILNTHSRS